MNVFRRSAPQEVNPYEPAPSAGERLAAGARKLGSAVVSLVSRQRGEGPYGTGTRDYADVSPLPRDPVDTYSIGRGPSSGLLPWLGKSVMNNYAGNKKN